MVNNNQQQQQAEPSRILTASRSISSSFGRGRGGGRGRGRGRGGRTTSGRGNYSNNNSGGRHNHYHHNSSHQSPQQAQCDELRSQYQQDAQHSNVPAPRHREAPAPAQEASVATTTTTMNATATLPRRSTSADYGSMVKFLYESPSSPVRAVGDGVVGVGGQPPHPPPRSPSSSSPSSSSTPHHTKHHYHQNHSNDNRQYYNQHHFQNRGNYGRRNHQEEDFQNGNNSGGNNQKQQQYYNYSNNDGNFRHDQDGYSHHHEHQQPTTMVRRGVVDHGDGSRGRGLGRGAGGRMLGRGGSRDHGGVTGQRGGGGGRNNHSLDNSVGNQEKSRTGYGGGGGRHHHHHNARQYNYNSNYYDNNNNNKHYRNHHHYHHHSSSYYQQQRQYHRTKEDRASARKKASSDMFYLHSSSDHAFIITRVPSIKQQATSSSSVSNANSSYTFNGSDHAVSWSSVKIVKQLSRTNNKNNNVDAATETCPICLDTYCCARITKCGHSFCLPCLIHHIQTYVADHPYSTTARMMSGSKCPCCSLPIHLDDVRPVQFITVTDVQPQTCINASSIIDNTSKQQQQKQRMKLIKLHRQGRCPAPYLPTITDDLNTTSSACNMRHSSPHAAPSQSDSDAPYCRFNYIDPDLYQQHLMDNIHELQQQLQAYDVSSVDYIFVNMSITIVQRDIQLALDQYDEEKKYIERFQQSSTGFYQDHPKHLIAESAKVSSSTKTDTATVTTIARPRKNFMTQNNIENVTRKQRRGRSDSYNSSDSYDEGGGDIICENYNTNDQEQRQQQQREEQQEGRKGTMFADNQEHVFYQAQDGTLCFLCGFNISCLRTEYTLNLPEQQQEATGTIPINHHDHFQPLPDCIEGEVLGIERVHLLPEVRDRRRFLSHLPLYVDVVFVEMNLNHLLSRKTLIMFHNDLEYRRDVREARQREEKRADEKAKQQEQARIDERKSRIQIIDPDDEFFHPHNSSSMSETTELALLGEAFGPALTVTTTNNSNNNNESNVDDTPAVTNANQQQEQTNSGSPGALSFSQVCREGGRQPSNDTHATGGANFSVFDDDFPALGSPAPPPPPPPRSTKKDHHSGGWGGNNNTNNNSMHNQNKNKTITTTQGFVRLN